MSRVCWIVANASMSCAHPALPIGWSAPNKPEWRLLLHRHNEFVHDVILPLRRVLAHVEVEDRAGLGARRIFHTVAVRQHLNRISLPMNCWNSFGLIPVSQVQRSNPRVNSLRRDLVHGLPYRMKNRPTWGRSTRDFVASRPDRSRENASPAPVRSGAVTWHNRLSQNTRRPLAPRRRRAGQKAPHRSSARARSSSRSPACHLRVRALHRR